MPPPPPPPSRHDLVHAVYDELYAVVAALIGGAKYGFKIRVPHAVVMTALFRRQLSAEQKVRFVLRLAWEHAANLASFACIYKLLLSALKYVSRRLRRRTTALLLSSMSTPNEEHDVSATAEGHPNKTHIPINIINNNNNNKNDDDDESLFRGIGRILISFLVDGPMFWESLQQERRFQKAILERLSRQPQPQGTGERSRSGSSGTTTTEDNPRSNVVNRYYKRSQSTPAVGGGDAAQREGSLRRQLLLPPAPPGHPERVYHSFVAGAVGGYLVWGRYSSVNYQVVLYLTSRVLVALYRRLVERRRVLRSRTGGAAAGRAAASTGSGRSYDAYPVAAAVVWGLVMALFEDSPELLHPSLKQSMDEIYRYGIMSMPSSSSALRLPPTTKTMLQSARTPTSTTPFDTDIDSNHADASTRQENHTTTSRLDMLRSLFQRERQHTM